MPEPDDKLPSERYHRVIEEKQAALLEACMELAGAEMLLEACRRERDISAEKFFDIASERRQKEAVFDKSKLELINAHQEHIALISKGK